MLVSMGGIASRLPIERWPRIGGVRWLVEQSWQVGHPDAIVLESLPMNFSDLLASSDALVCKPGYGSFVEAGLRRRAGAICQPRRLAGIAPFDFMAATIRPVP